MKATDVLAAVGTLNGFPPCPIIVLCGDAGTSFGRDVIQAGAQDYIGQEWLTPRGLHRAIENAGDRWAVARELVERNRDADQDERVAGIEEKIVRLDGRVVPVHVIATPIMDCGVSAVLVALSDLTERERSTSLLRSVLDSVNDAILTVDDCGTIHSANLHCDWTVPSED